MNSQYHRPHRSERPRWQSLGQLAELWELSRARTRVVLQGLVRSGRMEVRTLERDHDVVRQYRAVQRG